MLLMGLPCLGVKSFLFHGTGVKVSFPSVLYLQFTILSFMKILRYLVIKISENCFKSFMMKQVEVRCYILLFDHQQVYS